MTDSARVEDAKDPDCSALYAILKLFCTSEEQADWADRFRHGGLSYREVKQAIFDHYMERFGAARARRRELAGRPEYVEEVLRRGAEQARLVTRPLVREAIPIVADVSGVDGATGFVRDAQASVVCSLRLVDSGTIERR